MSSPRHCEAQGDVGTRLCEAQGMSLAALVHGRGNPVYLLQPPDVRCASQCRESARDERCYNIDEYAFSHLYFLISHLYIRSALAKTGGSNGPLDYTEKLQPVLKSHLHNFFLRNPFYLGNLPRDKRKIPGIVALASIRFRRQIRAISF